MKIKSMKKWFKASLLGKKKRDNNLAKKKAAYLNDINPQQCMSEDYHYYVFQKMNQML